LFPEKQDFEVELGVGFEQREKKREGRSEHLVRVIGADSKVANVVRIRYFGCGCGFDEAHVSSQAKIAEDITTTAVVY
jgi:hypothetical protein